jgi:hypothetical protein
MFAMRRWLRSNAAKAFVIAVLGAQLIPVVQACPMPMMDISMAYATADMPEACPGLAKQACLLAYIQADRAFGSDSATISAHPAAVLRLAPPNHVALAARGGVSNGPRVHSGAPPPRLLFCRMLT